MRTLLDKSSQRIIQILEILVDREDWTTIKDLSFMIDASERTLSEDISTLKRRWGNYLNIELSIKNGVRIPNPNISMLGTVFISLFNESTALRLLETIFLNPREKIEFYEKKLFISRSTILRLIPKINLFLGTKEISIQCQNGQYELFSKNEQFLRQFFTGFMIELHGLTLSEEYNTFDLNLIGTLFNRIIAQHSSVDETRYITTENIAVIYFIMFYLVSLLRENEGYSVASDYDVSCEINEDELSYIKNYFPTITLENIRPIHEFIKLKFAGWDSEEEKIHVETEIVNFFDHIFDVIQVALEPAIKDRLYYVLKTIYFTAKLRPYPTSALFDRIYYFEKSFKKNNEALYFLIKTNLANFSSHVHVDQSERLSDILFWICLNCPELSKSPIKKTALVISDFGMQHADYLARFFSTFFNNDKVKMLKTTSAILPDALHLDVSKYDIIITTIPNLPISHKHIILVNDYPSEENLFTLDRLLQQSKH